MNIIGPDELIFGVDNMDACKTFLADYGLTATQDGPEGGSYEALDGTAITLRHRDDASLPPPKRVKHDPGCPEEATMS